jgi:hypothetical protein
MWYVATALTVGFFTAIFVAESHFKYLIRKQEKRVQEDHQKNVKINVETATYKYAYAMTILSDLERLI